MPLLIFVRTVKIKITHFNLNFEHFAPAILPVTEDIFFLFYISWQIFGFIGSVTSGILRLTFPYLPEH